jgi:hypothetical protein
MNAGTRKLSIVEKVGQVVTERSLRRDSGDLDPKK